MLELNADTLVGKGLHREVHVHPENKDLCVKVVVNRGVEETRREQAYYQLLQKRKVSWEMLPRFHGNIDTNIGSGAIFDLVRDNDGQVSKTLEFYLEDASLSLHHQAAIISALSSLKAYLLEENIVTMTLKPKNIVFQFGDGGSARCIVIDNIGNSDIIPVSSYIQYFGKRKIERKWLKFKNLMRKQFKEQGVIESIVSNI